MAVQLNSIGIFNLALFTDRMQCDLEEYTNNESGAEQNQKARNLAMLGQIAQGLKVFREHKIIHGDLKPQNILLTSDF